MNLLLSIPPKTLADAYDRVKAALANDAHILLQAAAEMQSGPSTPATWPPGAAEADAKHNELRKRIATGDAAGGRDLAFNLLGKVYEIATRNGGLPGIDVGSLLDAIQFRTDKGATLRFSEDGRWVAVWAIRIEKPYREKGAVLLGLHHITLGELVPPYVVEYIASAVEAYNRGLYAPAVALLAIATEATLRDALKARGYEYHQRASDVDIYRYGAGAITVIDGEYVLRITSAVPKTVSDFSSSASGMTSVPIEIRREIEIRRGKPNRLDLRVKMPEPLIEHFAPADVEQSAKKRVNGLGEALDIARNTEHIVTTGQLPLSFEVVLRTIRNNLVHLSEDALMTEIKSVPDPDRRGKSITVGKFISSPPYVYSVFLGVPSFIDQQYLTLRQLEAGT